jgi:sulfonate transport system ATP-binding protein
MLTRAQAEYSAVARLRGITHRVAEVVSLDHVDLSIHAGDFTALLGAEGSGNGALLRMLAGLETPTSGSIDVADEKTIVFGDPRLLPWKTVIQNVALGLGGSDTAERARAALADVGFKAEPEALPATLSAGDALRASIARALVRNPRLLLLDSPFAALDPGTRLQMRRLVESLWLRHDLTVVLATHDVDEAIDLADRIVVVDGGRIVTSIDNELPWPHETSHPGFPSLRARLQAAMRVNG